MSVNRSKKQKNINLEKKYKLSSKRKNQALQEVPPKKRRKREVEDVADSNSASSPLPSAEGKNTVAINQIHYQYLLAIFPDADPIYLQEKCEEIAGNDEKMNEFIETALQSKDYPKYSNCLQKRKESELLKKFTSDFTVNSFVELFPDSTRYFEEKGPTEERKKGLIYLKNSFRNAYARDIDNTFKKCKYNIAKTYKTLSKLRNKMKTTRRIIPNDLSGCKISFIQEIAYAENHQAIENYLKEKEQERQADFLKAQANGELLQCSCCFNEEFLIYEMVACMEGHLFCKECVGRAAEVAVGDGKTSLQCLTNCEAGFSIKILETAVKPAVLSRMLQNKQLEEIEAAGIEGLENCLYCNFAAIPAENDKVFRCQNPECMKETCRLCKEPNHIPLRCDELEKGAEIKIRTAIEDYMTEALVRKCWKCNRPFIKEDGCNKMSCVCGALMCYVCRKPVQGYDHFDRLGATNSKLCPLYSNNNELHVEAVKEAAFKAKEEVLAKNPHVKLKVDPTEILPEEYN